jgi:RNA polymerase sigma factor (sigma-70 family)
LGIKRFGWEENPNPVVLRNEEGIKPMTSNEIAELAETHYERLCAWIYSSCNDYHWSQDIAQRVFERILSRPPEAAFRGDSDVMSWLVSIAQREMSNDAKYNHRHVLKAISLDEKTDQFEAAAQGGDDDGRVDPLAGAEGLGTDPADEVEALQAVAKSVSKLEKMEQTNPGWAEAFKLVREEGRSYQEASDLTGVPISTIGSRMTRARTLLEIRRDENLRGTKPRETPVDMAKRLGLALIATSVKARHIWYSRIRHGEAPGPTYPGQPELPRTAHLEIGGASKPSACPHFGGCPICKPFYDRKRHL